MGGEARSTGVVGEGECLAASQLAVSSVLTFPDYLQAIWQEIPA